MRRLRTVLGATATAAGAALLAAVLVPAAHAAGPELANPGDAAQVQHVEMPLVGHAPSGLPARAAAVANAAVPSGNGIDFHGGPVLTAPVKAYVIWYGSWSGNTATSILTDLISGIGGSPWYAINTTYTDGAGNPVVPDVRLGGQTNDNYSQGKRNLTDSAIQKVVSRALATGALPVDANGVYFVLTSADVSKIGFLTQYCGWHTYAAISNAVIKYSFVGNPGSNRACNVQTTSSPNANPGADAMASVLAHELVEAVSDPQLNAWYDAKGYENADKCAWTFGATYALANGSKANMRIGVRDYLIQQNWLNASGGRCALKYP